MRGFLGESIFCAQLASRDTSTTAHAGILAAAKAVVEDLQVWHLLPWSQSSHAYLLYTSICSMSLHLGFITGAFEKVLLGIVVSPVLPLLHHHFSAGAAVWRDVWPVLQP